MSSVEMYLEQPIVSVLDLSSDVKHSPFNVCNGLSAYKSKVYRFPQESYFQEFWYEATDALGEELRFLLDQYTFVIFKPDAGMGRCMHKALQYLSSRGYEPVHVQSFRFTRHLIRELWRYELNLSSRERYSVIDPLLESSDSLFMLLKASPSSNCSASQKISELKGSSQKSKRDSHSFRESIGAYDGTLNFVHTPDETIDLIREVGVLFDKKDRDHLLEIVRRPHGPVSEEKLLATIEGFYAGVPEADFDCERILERYQHGFRFDEGVSEIDMKLVVKHAVNEITKAGVLIDEYDEIILRAYSMFPNTDNVEQILEYEEKRLFS